MERKVAKYIYDKNRPVDIQEVELVSHLKSRDLNVVDWGHDDNFIFITYEESHGKENK